MARGLDGFGASPRKIGLKGTIPAMFKSMVGSSGTRLALGRQICRLHSKKDKNASRICAEVKRLPTGTSDAAMADDGEDDEGDGDGDVDAIQKRRENALEGVEILKMRGDWKDLVQRLLQARVADKGTGAMNVGSIGALCRNFDRGLKR